MCIVARPPQFRLRLARGEKPLALGDFVIGRSEGCDLVLDDPVASRRHAVLHVMPSQVVLEDLGSRNGVLVNGVRMFDATTIAHGDRLLIGSTEMWLIEMAARSRREDMATRPLIVTGVQARDASAQEWESATETGSVYDVLIAACDRAFMQGSHDEAAASVRNLLLSVRAGVLRRQTPDSHTLRTTIGFAVELADRTSDVAWLDRLFEVLVASRAVPDDAAVERLGRLVPRLGMAGVQALQAFVARMQALPDLDAAALTRLQALEGAVRQVGT
jgi:hypothetical protein